MEIVINRCWGGYSLSDKACEMLGINDNYDFYDMIQRTDSRLVDCVRSLGRDANGRCANLQIVEIPAETTDWEIDEYDGFESVTYVVDGKLYHI